jgi:hypothetical protein
VDMFMLHLKGDNLIPFRLSDGGYLIL